MRLFGRGGRGVKVKPPVVKPPANKPPATTKGGRPITSSTGRGTTKPDATKPPVSGGQPSLSQRVSQRVRDLNNKIPPKVRTGAAVLGAAGLSVLGGKIGMDNNLIPGIPDSPSNLKNQLAILWQMVTTIKTIKVIAAIMVTLVQALHQIHEQNVKDVITLGHHKQ